MDRNAIVSIIVDRLNSEKESLKSAFQQRHLNIPTRYFVIDDLLPAEIVQNIYDSFPKSSQMRRMKSFRERKFTSKDLNRFDPLLTEITFSFQDPKVIELISEITGFEAQTGDPHLYAGGLSLMVNTDFLNPHIDNSHNHTQDKYRTGNILYYVSPDWKESSGGNLELWDKEVKENLTIVSKFNRLVFMETNLHSWHSVSPLTVDANRCCVSNYYFSALSPMNKDYFHVTSFSGRPNQKIVRVWSKIDNELRQFARKIKKGGFGKKDLLKVSASK